MLKKKLGAEIIEERIIECHISWFYKVPPTLIIPENVKGIRFEVFDSCKKLKKVTLNSELIYKDTKYLDYVIVHELSHFKHANHGKGFWSLVEENEPNYKKIRKECLRSYELQE